MRRYGSPEPAAALFVVQRLAYQCAMSTAAKAVHGG